MGWATGLLQRTLRLFPSYRRKKDAEVWRAYLEARRSEQPTIGRQYGSQGPDPRTVDYAWIFATDCKSAMDVEFIRDFGNGVAVFRLTGQHIYDGPNPLDRPVRCFAYDPVAARWEETATHSREVLRLPEEMIVEIESMTGYKYARGPRDVL